MKIFVSAILFWGAKSVITVIINIYSCTTIENIKKNLKSNLLAYCGVFFNISQYSAVLLGKNVPFIRFT